MLVVEDEHKVARALKEGLEGEGYGVVVEDSGEGALARLKTEPFDVMLLDLLLPGRDGLDVLKTMRQQGYETPVLVLTARDALEDRVAGLDTGADDYLVKPFAYEELAARLRALARRSEPGARRPDPVLAAGPISLDERSRRVTVDGRAIDLSPREFSLLECFLRHPGQSLTRDQLLDQAWPFSVAVTPNAVDAYVHYLRTKLGAAGRWIETVRGVGYRLARG